MEDSQLEDKKVEPNSSPGQTISYVLIDWIDAN